MRSDVGGTHSANLQLLTNATSFIDPPATFENAAGEVFSLASWGQLLFLNQPRGPCAQQEKQIVKPFIPKIRNSCYNTRVAGAEAGRSGLRPRAQSGEERFYLNRP